MKPEILRYLNMESARFQMPKILAMCIEQYIEDANLRIYFRPVNGKFPKGYAQTFKVVATKPRRKRK